jgi:hypothetical protein
MVTKWTADVLLCTAEKFTRVNSLELELMAKRRLCCSRAADEFASSIPASSAVPVSKFRLFFWLLERRLWYLFSAALRHSEHPVLVVPAAVPLLEEDVHWLGPLLAYLAGWAFEQKINIHIKESSWFSRGCSGLSARAVSFFLFLEGF